MEKKYIQNKKIPDAPGVYFFLGVRKEILYIGRATSLKDRVRSYFDLDVSKKRSPLIEKMVTEAKSVEWTATDSVLEAMILEVNLIRTHKPRFNIVSKDDKSYNHLVITNETYPRVLVVRGKDVTEKFDRRELKYIFGPFPSAGLFKEALKIMQRLFQFYDTKRPISEMRSKMAKGTIDFNRQIGLYPDTQTKKKYAQTIRHIKLFFEGKKGQIIRELKKEMQHYAEKERFEKAHEIKKKIFALTHIQDVALIKDNSRIYRDDRTIRIEAYDVAHLSGSDMVGVMTVLEGSVPLKSDYRRFKVRSVEGSNDPAALREVIERRLDHAEWPLPQVIVVDGGTAQKNATEYVLKKHEVLIPVVGVIKDEKHNPKQIIGPRKLIAEYGNDILLANAESHRFAVAYHRSKRKIHS